jgi:hypothetical protein
MPHRRRLQKGSFGSHFDELVSRFPAVEEQPTSAPGAAKRDPKLQAKIDIHALLFRAAWEVERER